MPHVFLNSAGPLFLASHFNFLLFPQQMILQHRRIGKNYSDSNINLGLYCFAFPFLPLPRLIKVSLDTSSKYCDNLIWYKIVKLHWKSLFI